MANKEITGRVKNRSDTKARWASVNPILALGELGFESDTGKLKVGDGATTWNNLDYYGGGGSAIDAAAVVDILGGVSFEPQESILISEVMTMIKKEVAQAKSEILNTSFPVGAIWISVNDVNPSTLFGGTWEKIADGRTLIGSGSQYALGSTGGEETHTLSVEEMPTHGHDRGGGFLGQWGEAGKWVQGTIVSSPTWGSATAYTKEQWGDYGANVGNQLFFNQIEPTFNAIGDNQPHNNMQPYLVVNIWKRIA